MKLNDLFGELLLEWGSHGFPGTGNRLFTRAGYQVLAGSLRNYDREVREDATNWFVEVLKKDNGNFDEDRFRKHAASAYGSSSYEFQQRHFYYLAHFISQLHLQKRIYLARRVGITMASSNHNFSWDRWWPYCEVPEAYRNY